MSAQHPLPFAGALDPDGLLLLVRGGPDVAALLAAPHPEDAELVAAARRDALGGSALEVEYRALGPDGAVRWVVERLEPARDGVAVTGEIASADELDATELARLVGALDEALYVVDVLPGGQLVPRWLGPGWEQLLGCPVPEGHAGLDAWASAVHPDDAEAFLARTDDLLAGGPSRAAYRLRGLDGVERWVSDRARARPLPGGGVRAEGIVVDITDERRLAERLEDAQERLNAVLAGVDDLVYTLQLLDDGALHAVVTSPAALRVVGAFGPDGVLDLWGDAVVPDDRPARDRLRAAVLAGRPDDAELRVLGRDGHERWIWHRVRPRTDAVGRRLVDGVASDITRRRKVAEDLATVQRRLDAVLATIEEVLLSVELRRDGALHPLYVGPGVERLLGGPLPQRAEPFGILRASLHADDRRRFDDALRSLRAGRAIDVEFRVVGLDGRTRWVLWRARPRLLPDGVEADGILADVTVRRLAADALAAERDAAERAARVDQLTGAWNRRHVREVLADALATRRDGLAILLLDVDRFKSVNDTHGHHVGDQVLVEVAQRLDGSVRGSDLVGRWGGEEFCVVLDRVRDDDALRRIGEGLRGVLARTPFRTDAGLLPVTASFGAARPAARQDVDALVNAADEALYAAKHAGRNRIVLVSELSGLSDAAA